MASATDRGCESVLEQKARRVYLLPVEFLIQNCLILLIMLWAIQNTGRRLGKVLNSGMAVHVGFI